MQQEHVLQLSRGYTLISTSSVCLCLCVVRPTLFWPSPCEGLPNVVAVPPGVPSNALENGSSESMDNSGCEQHDAPSACVEGAVVEGAVVEHLKEPWPLT